MTLLDRYVMREFLRLWGLLLGALVLLSQVIEVFTRLRRYADHSLSVGPFLGYLVLHFPQTLLVLSPIALMIATIVSVGLLNARQELLAMRSAGRSSRRIAFPLLLFALLVTAILSAANWTVIPEATRQSEYIKDVMLLQKPSASVFGQNRLWLRLDSQRLINVQLVHPTHDILFGVSVYSLDSNFSLTRLIEASSMTFQHDQWIVTKGTKRSFRSDGSIETVALENEPIELMKSPAEFREVVVDPDEMDGEQLGRYITQLRLSGLESRRHEINYYAKLAIPAVNLLMVMVAVPLGMQGGRWPQIARGIAIALVIGAIYALTHAYAVALGNQGIIPSIAAAWIANAVLLGLGALLLIRLR